MLFSLYLPGYSVSNQADLEAISKKFHRQEVPHYARYWDHWYEGGLAFDLEREAEQLTKVMKTLKFPDYAIFGKSIGSWTAVNLIGKWAEKKKPKLLVLMGIPFSELKTGELELYKTVIADTDFRTVIIQNSADPYGNDSKVHEEFKQQISEAKIDVIIPEADNHNYNYPELFIDLISEVDEHEDSISDGR